MEKLSTEQQRNVESLLQTMVKKAIYMLTFIKMGKDIDTIYTG